MVLSISIAKIGLVFKKFWIGNKWLVRLSHLFFKLYFRFFGPNFLFFCKFFQLFRNVQKFGIIRQKQRIVVSILSVIYYMSYKTFFHCVMQAIGSIFAWQKFIKTFFNRVLETKNVWAWYLNILCFDTK